MVAAFQVIADLVRLDRVAGEDLADRALDDARQRRMAGRDGVFTGMTRQQPRGPEFVRVSEVAGFLAGQRHQPGSGFRRDVRRLAGTRAVIKRRHHPQPRGTAQAPLHRMVGHSKPRSDRGRRRLRAIGQHDARARYSAGCFRARTRYRLQPSKFVRSDLKLYNAPRSRHVRLPS